MNVRSSNLTTTVIVATYNGEKYIHDQLESLLHQSVPIDEVVITDDGSTDSTERVVQDFISKNNLEERWKFKQNHPAKGFARNFLDATKDVRGDIVFFCDQDDVWKSSKILKMMNIFSTHDQVTVLASDLELFSSGENPLKWSQSAVSDMNNSGTLQQIVVDSPHKLQCQRSGCTMCVRQAFLNSVREYWTEDWAHDDFLWKMGALSNGLAIYHEKLIRRRLHNNNVTNVKIRTRQKRILQVKKLQEQYLSCQNYLREQGTGENYELTHCVNKNILAAQLREKVLTHRNILGWLHLVLSFRDCYPWYKALLLDGFFIFFSTQRSR